MEAYDSSANYFMQLIKFAEKRPNFNSTHLGESKYALRLAVIDRSMQSNSFIDFTDDSYNRFWYKWLTSDRMIEKKTEEGLKLTISQIDKGDTLQDNWIFLTLNFNDTEYISAQKMLHFAQEICKKEWVGSATYVIEKHRCQGIHHHIHLLIDLNIHQRKGKIIELVYKIAGLKKYCAGKQYIDVKCAKDLDRAPREVYENYVRGDKKEEKMVHVLSDRKWRKENLIEDLYNYVKV